MHTWADARRRAIGASLPRTSRRRPAAQGTAPRTSPARACTSPPHNTQPANPSYKPRIQQHSIGTSIAKTRNLLTPTACNVRLPQQETPNTKTHLFSRVRMPPLWFTREATRSPRSFLGKLRVFRPNSAKRPFWHYSQFLVCPRNPDSAKF